MFRGRLNSEKKLFIDFFVIVVFVIVVFKILAILFAGWRYALLSMKVTIARVILNYRFSTTFEYRNLHFVEDITIKLKETPHLRVYERNKNYN